MKDAAKRLGGIFGIVAMISFLAPGDSPAQVSLRVTPVPVDQLSIGDLDFSTSSSRSLLFTVDIQTTPSIQVVLTVNMDVQLPDQNLPSALTFQTAPFSVGLTGSKRFTNLDFRSGSEIRLGGDVQYSSEAQSRVRDVGLSTGRLPAGTYTVRLRLLNTSGQQLGVDQFALTIRNISRLDLMSPRDGEAVPSPYPLFMWVYDGDQAQISVYEWRPTQHSKEEAAQGTPMMQQVVTGVRSFQYPTAGVRSLEAGKSYVWKLVGITRGTGGKGLDVQSEIWQFNVAAASGPALNIGGVEGMTNTQQLALLTQLQNVPGLVPDLLNLLSSGAFHIRRMSPNSAALVQAILNDLAQNPDKIIEVVLQNQ